jgi:SAM-dependent methyltransferase
MTDTGKWFEEWFNSPYYHRLYFKRDEAEAAKFINNLIEYFHPAPGSLMLDIACGRGRHSKQLQSKGFDVTGIDLSPDNIREARKNESETLHYFVHDMRLPFWINYFDYALNLFTSFGYFKTRREHENSIRTIAQSLKPNGMFVIDYLNVHYEEEHLISESEFIIENINYSITKWFDETHFYKKIIIKDKALKAPGEYLEKVARFTLDDFTEMLASYQLQVQEVFGDYNFNQYDIKNSPRMIIVARKNQIP